VVSWVIRKVDAGPWTVPACKPSPIDLFVINGTSRARLADIAEIRTDYLPVDDGLPFVTPSDVSTHTGTVVPSTTSSRSKGFVLGENLREHDILISRSNWSFPVYVTSAHRGVAFSSAFHIIRSVQHCLLLWAILGSSTAKGALSANRADASLRERVSEMTVPIPAVERLGALEELLPDPAVDVFVADRARSSWTVATIASDAWIYDRAITEIASDGLTIADFARVSLGDVARDERAPVQLAGMLPVATSREVAKGEKRWETFARPEKHRRSEAGTVVLTSLPPFRACVLGTDVLIERHLLRLDLKEVTTVSVSPDNLCAFVRSAKGQWLLKAHASGSVIPRLSVSGLRNVVVPRDVIRSLSLDGSSLSERIEETLRRIVGETT
jgi:hypothetical protein